MNRLSEWWEWPIVQWYYYRRYKRATSKINRREDDQIRWHYVWTGKLINERIAGK